MGHAFPKYTLNRTASENESFVAVTFNLRPLRIESFYIIVIFSMYHKSGQSWDIVLYSQNSTLSLGAKVTSFTSDYMMTYMEQKRDG